MSDQAWARRVVEVNQSGALHSGPDSIVLREPQECFLALVELRRFVDRLGPTKSEDLLPIVALGNLRRIATWLSYRFEDPGDIFAGSPAEWDLRAIAEVVLGPARSVSATATEVLAVARDEAQRTADELLGVLMAERTPGRPADDVTGYLAGGLEARRKYFGEENLSPTATVLGAAWQLRLALPAAVIPGEGRSAAEAAVIRLAAATGRSEEFMARLPQGLAYLRRGLNGESLLDPPQFGEDTAFLFSQITVDVPRLAQQQQTNLRLRMPAGGSSHAVAGPPNVLGKGQVAGHVRATGQRPERPPESRPGPSGPSR